MAPGKLGITGSTEAPSRRSPQSWLVMMVVAAILMASAAIIVTNLPSASVTPPFQGGIPMPVATSTPAPTPLPTPAKILGQTDMGLILVGFGSGKHGSYGLGYWFTPPGNPEYPNYDFPVIVSRGDPENGWQQLTEIADPDLEIGGKSTITVRDPDYEGFVLKVELIRVDAAYKYKSKFFFSPNNGESWFPPAEYPSGLPSGS